MKNAAILIFAAFAGIAIAGDPPKLEKLTLKNGREYEKVTVIEKRPDGISISHDSGTARIKFEDLPEDVAAKLGGFNADDAAATRKKADAEEAATIAEIDKGLAAQKVVRNSNIGKPLDYFKDKYGKPVALEKNVASFTKAGVYIMVIFMDEKAVRLVYSKGLVNDYGQTETFTENEFAAIGESNASGGDWQDDGKTTFTRSFISGDKRLSCYFDMKSNTITVSSLDFNRMIDDAEKKKLKGL